MFDKLNKNDIDSLASLIKSGYWKAFLKLVKIEKETRKEAILGFLSAGEVEKATRESQRIEDFDFLVSRPWKIVNKEKVKEVEEKKVEEKKTDYEINEKSIPEGLIE